MTAQFEKCIILANGKPPKKKVLQFLREQGYETLICADGGADTARAKDVLPDVIIGDLDSVTPETLKAYEGRTEILHLERQDDTDIEKALSYAHEHGCREAVLLGAIGNRLDHSFCNLGIALKFDDRLKVRIVHRKSFLGVYEGTVEIRTLPGETISLYGFDAQTRFTTEGLRYPLSGEALPFGVRESASNVAESDLVSVTIKGGKGFIIRDFPFMMKHDLF